MNGDKPTTAVVEQSEKATIFCVLKTLLCVTRAGDDERGSSYFVVVVSCSLR